MGRTSVFWEFLEGGYRLSAFHYSETRVCFSKDVDHNVSLDKIQLYRNAHQKFQKKKKKGAAKHVSFIVAVAF